MADYIEQQARVTDGVAHTTNDFAFGLSVAFIAGGIVFAPLTVAGVITVISTASFVHGVGGFIDRQLPREITERIDQGAATVFLDESRHPAAMAVPTTTLDEHGGHWVCKGSHSVLIEGFNASRIGDTTSCAGTIVEGSSTVFTGGNTVLAPGAPTDPREVIGNDLYQTYSELLRIGGYAQLPRTGWQGAVYATSAANDLGLAPEGTGDALVAQGLFGVLAGSLGR